MPKRSNTNTGSELFIVDNSDDDWKAFAISTIGADFQEHRHCHWLLRGWRPSRTRRRMAEARRYPHSHGRRGFAAHQSAFEAALSKPQQQLDHSLESRKAEKPLSRGVPAIVDALQAGKIECRVYRKDKFHAKAYITHAKLDVVGSSALVGSSNFTFPGLTENIELNVQITGTPVAVLQEWYEEHWEEAEDVTPDILKRLRTTRPQLTRPSKSMPAPCSSIS